MVGGQFMADGKSNMKINEYKISPEENAEIRQVISNYLSLMSLDDIKGLQKTEILPKDLKEWIRKRKEENDSVFLIRNCPIDAVPRWYSYPNNTGVAFLYSASRQLGLPLGVHSHKNGIIIQDLFPKESDKDKQLGSNSINLEFHTENAHLKPMNQYIALLYLRGDPKATTTYCQINFDDIPESIFADLQKHCYYIKADDSFAKKENYDGPLITTTSNSFLLRYDPHYTECLGEISKYALDWLTDYIKENKQGILLNSGDLLFINNYCVVHGRSAYQPDFDGFDRWIKRLNIYPEETTETEAIKDHVLANH